MTQETTHESFRKNFSQRNGFTSIPPPLNPGEITDQLRLELYDLLQSEFMEGSWAFKHGEKAADWEKVLASLWVQKFRRERVSGMHALCLEECRRVMAHRNFDEVFNLVEDLAIRIGEAQPTFQNEINSAFARNQAPYVLYKSLEKGWMIIETGTEIERETVLQCLSDLKDPAFEKTRGHFEKAGRHLTKGESPEAAGQSAKALEACLRKLAGKPDFTGGQALELYAKTFDLPPPLKETIKGVWKYRNEAEDVGHSEKENATCPPPDKWDAKAVYTIVASCITYLINRKRPY